MGAEVFAFYLFAISTITGGLFTVLSRNPVHSVLWLILSFLSSAGLFILLGAEFVAMLLIIVYVGAVAVLFLFVVMMLDVDFASLKADLAKYLPLGLLIMVILLMELAMGLAVWVPADGAEAVRAAPTPSDTHNTEALGLLLYDKYFLLFQLAGLILLVAMIGAIVLTFRKREGVKKQSYIKQISRERSEGVELLEVESNKGVKIDD